jgi:predicted alpha/beta hydrolase family esterase
MRILLVPRWSGTGDSDFYPWLRREIADRHPGVTFEIAELQPPDAPDLERTVAGVAAALDASERSSTLLVGHSVGAQAAMRALARSSGRDTLHAFLGVAAWWTVDQPWPSILPWLETPFDAGAVRELARHRRVLVSTDDPFTADHVETRRAFEARIGATADVIEGARHFNASSEPAVLRAIEELLGAG